MKINIPIFFISLIFLLSNNIFYLMPSINSDIILLVIVAFIIYSITVTKKKVKHGTRIMEYIIMFIPIIMITSSIAANKFYGQSIWMGLRPQRTQLICWYSFYAFYFLFKADMIKREKIEKIIIYFAIIEMIIGFLFEFSNGKLGIFSISYDYRYNHIRIRSSMMMIVFAFAIWFNNVLKNNNTKNSLILLIIDLIFTIYCIQTRLLILAMIICLFVIFIIWKKNIFIKLLIIPLIILVCYGVIQTNAGQDIVNSVLYNETDGSQDIRKEGKNFYLNQLKNSPWIGIGFINTQDYTAYTKSGMNDGYYLVDNGLVAFYYLYGIMGLIWIGSLFIKYLIDSYYVLKNNNDYTSVILIAINIVLSPNIIWWWWSPTFMFLSMIYLANTEVEVIKLKNKKLAKD